MTQYAFYFDSTRCTGCKTCELACKDYKDLDQDFAFRRILDCEGGSWKQEDSDTYSTSAFVYHVSLACNHCGNPACVKVCPTTAMHKSSSTGLVSVDAGKCIGCGYCHMACPYSAPKVDREKGHSVKCDGCQDRVLEGKRPICVEACPLRALDFGTFEDIRAAHPEAEQADIAPLPEASYTSPNLYIKACADVLPAGDTSATLANPLEVE